MKTTILPDIHISDVRAFRSCRRRWEWSSPLKQNLEPNVVYPPFFTGRAIHEALEMHYKNGDDILSALNEYVIKEVALMLEQGAMWPGEETTLNEQVALAQGMLRHYQLWQANDSKKYSDRNLKFLELEYPFDVSLPTGRGGYSRKMRIAGRFDGLVYNTLTDEYWLWETKTTRSVSELLNSLCNDEQSALYLYAANRIFSKPITGVLYNIIRKKIPPTPRVLQNGLLSKAAIDTTTFAYVDCIHELVPDWSVETIEEFYGDVLASLMENESKYFLRWPVYKSATEVESVMSGVYETAKEMTNPRIALYPSPGWLACNFCHFKSPCLAQNMGGDFETLLKEEYHPRPQTPPIIEEENNND